MIALGHIRMIELIYWANSITFQNDSSGIYEINLLGKFVSFTLSFKMIALGYMKLIY